MEKNPVRIVALFCIFVNLFSVWLTTQQLGSHICFCIQSVLTYCLVRGIGRCSILTQVCHWKKKNVFYSLFR